MEESPIINIIMATDAKGLEPNATVLNSLRRHNPGRIHVRIFVRDLPAASYEVGRMKVEFIVTPEELRQEGKVPDHVAAGPTFDRMVAMRCCDDWDRALILDYDQLVVGDISELFRMELGDALFAGRVFHLDLGEASRQWFGRRLPYIYRHCSSYKFLMMGPVLNLKAMRESDIYEKFSYANRVANSEEQIALHLACEDRTIGIPAVYNVVPSWDGYGKDALIFHFTGPVKPWNNPDPEPSGWWAKYETTWEELTDGAMM